LPLAVCWVAFPLLLGLLAQGCGALLERLAGRALALGIRIPCGVALMIAVLDAATRSPATAHLAVAAVVAIAAAGLALSPPWRGHRGSRTHGGAGAAAPIAAATIVLAVYAAPVVLSGIATWTGYIKLDDTATWLALVDRALAHGRTVADLPPSSYRATLESYLTLGYPLGSFLPLGIGHALLGEDTAWLVNPWMAFMAAVLALALHRIAALCLTHPPRGADWRPVAVAALAAQPALLYGYYLWGGIKELAAAFLIAAFAVAAPPALGGKPHVRPLIPAAVVLWALIAALSPGGLVWVGPGLLLALALAALAGGLRRSRASGLPPASRSPRPGAEPPPTPEPRGQGASLPPTWALGAGLAATTAGAYLVLRPGGFVEHFHAVLTGGHELGNLAAPLSVAQVAGIWPTGDFRFAPSAATATGVLIGLVLLCAVAGLAFALHERRRELALYLLCALAGALLVDVAAAPWLGAKALASASPALPLAALTALCVAWERRPHAAGAAILLAGGAIAAGIVWSNVLAYHDVSLAPRTQFAELAQIGTRIAGQGPTLMTEYQPYGARHFLREAAPEAASELRMREDPLIAGGLLEKGLSVDIDQLQLQAVLVYRTLVLQRSPLASRPPAPYRLTFADRFWEVWQRPAKLRQPVLWQLPLGDATHPGAVPSCATVMRLSSRRGVRSVLAAPVVNPQVVALTAGTHPVAWATSGSQLAPVGSGTARVTADVARAGRYSVWLGGSTRGPLSVSIDGRRVGAALQEIQEPGQYIPFGALAMSAGRHTVTLRYGGEQWRPGTGGPPEAIGPLVLRREAPRPPLLALAPASAHELCGRTLDWVEGLGS
jgi:hypothetical protein